MEKQVRDGQEISFPVLGWALRILAGIAFLAGIGLALLVLNEAIQRGLVPTDIGMAGLCIVSGLLLAVMLEGLRMLLRHQWRLVVGQRELLDALMKSPASHPVVVREAAPPGRAGAEGQLQMIFQQLMELNTNVLLTDEQRNAKHEVQAAVAERRMTGEFDHAMAGNDFARASEILDEFARLAPEAKKVQELRERMAVARQKAEMQDAVLATSRCNEAISVAAFDEAARIARYLLAKHPSSAQAADLVSRVSREAAQFQEQQRQRMYAEIQKHAAARQWRRALGAASVLLERFPNSPEAQAVTPQMSTLRDNARIEEVRERRDFIRDMINRKRFTEALQQAEEVIRLYPETAAAEELRGQLDRLRERAKEESHPA